MEKHSLELWSPQLRNHRIVDVYLPDSFARVCEARRAEVVAIISAPAMSTHGGPVKGFLRHAALFGARGTLTFGWRVLRGKLLDRLSQPGPGGPFHSVKAVARAHGIEVSDDEIDAQLSEIAEQEGQTLPQVKRMFQERGALGGLRASLLERKVVDFLVSKAILARG